MFILGLGLGCAIFGGILLSDGIKSKISVEITLGSIMLFFAGVFCIAASFLWR